MSLRLRTLRNTFAWFVLGVFAAGCKTAPPPSDIPEEEEEDVETKTALTEMMQHRAFVQLKTGVMIPFNNEFETAGIADGVSGVKGALETIQKGMWLGMEFDYARVHSSKPVSLNWNSPEQIQRSNEEFNNASTEQLMNYHDRFQVMLTWDYDIPLGKKAPKKQWDLYSPIFRLGLGLGGMVVNPEEADGVKFRTDFNNAWGFVGRPNLGLTFPFQQHVQAFLEFNLDFVVGSLNASDGFGINMDGTAPTSLGDTTTQNIEDKNAVQYSTANFYFGLIFEW